MKSNSTAILIKIKLRHSLGRPSRSDFVQSEFVGLGVQKNIQKIAHLWGVLRIVTKTLQNGSRQLRTDRNLLRNSTDRPKNKACVTGSDSFRKRTNRTLSRSRERNPKTGTDNHNIENQHCRVFF